MATINPRIFKAVRFLNIVPLPLIVFVRTVLLIAAVAGIVAKAFSYIAPAIVLPLSTSTVDVLLYGIAPIAIMIGFFEIFLRTYLMQPPLDQNSPAIERMDYFTARIWYKASNGGQVSLESLTQSLLKDSATKGLVHRLGITPADVAPSDQIQGDVNDVIAIMNQLREQRGTHRIFVSDLMAALYDTDIAFRQYILQHDLDRNDITALGSWIIARQRQKAERHFWTLSQQLRRHPIGVDWAYGFTPLLQQYGYDLSEDMERHDADIRLIGREDVLDQMERVLSRSGQQNVVLVGPDGVGKTTIINGLTQQIVRGLTLPAIAHKRVFEIDAGALLSSGTNPAQIEQTIRAVFDDALRAGNIIVVIHDLHTLMQDTGIGTADISAVIKPFLLSEQLQLIATMDEAGYHHMVEFKQDILNTLERIDVTEPDKAQTMQIVYTFIPTIEAQNKVFIPQQSIKLLIDRADALIPGTPFPEKALELLNEVVTSVQSNKQKIVTPQAINAVLTQKTHIPLGNIEQSEQDKLQNLQDLMHQEIVNQEQAIKQVANTVLRLRSGVTSGSKPAGSFLFVGPTGVGKTLTAQILSKVYFGSTDHMIRFDMSSFTMPESIDRFIGSPRTNEPSQFLNAVRDNPYSVILLDEFEKAHPDIVNVFLPVFDEGYLTDAFDQKISLKQNIIIATSNAGAEHIREMVDQQMDLAKEKESIVEFMLSNNLFRPELINRFDDVIVFHPLNQQQVYEVARIMLNAFAKRLAKQNYIFEPSAEIISYVAEAGFDPQFGARPMRRVIQDTVEVAIANMIIAKSIQKGIPFSINVSDLPRV